jgi:dsDNA-specific endonuclease/ATPase MutS2
MQGAAALGEYVGLVVAIFAALASIASIIVAFTVVRIQAKQNKEDIDKLKPLVDKLELLQKAVEGDVTTLQRDVAQITIKQAEQDKSHIEIKTSLARIETTLEYLKRAMPKATQGTRITDKGNEVYTRHEEEWPDLPEI